MRLSETQTKIAVAVWALERGGEPATLRAVWQQVGEPWTHGYVYRLLEGLVGTWLMRQHGDPPSWRTVSPIHRNHLDQELQRWQRRGGRAVRFGGR